MAEGREGGLDPSLRWGLALLGFGLLVAGGAATFVTTNDVGTASLVAGGLAFTALAYLGDRITHLKAGGIELVIVQKAAALVQAASVAEGAGDLERADSLRAEAMEALNQLGSLGRSFEETRRSVPAGPERIEEMRTQVADARRLATEKGFDADGVRRLVASGRDGNRLVALGAMEAVPEARDFELVLGLVRDPRSSFEHYQSVLLAKEMVPELDFLQRVRLAEIVSRQLTAGFVRDLTEDNSRRQLMEDIIRATGS